MVGWLAVAYFAARDAHRASLRQDRRDAYVGLLTAAQSCADVAYESSLIEASADFLAGEDPAAFIEAAESKDACKQRLETAMAVIRLLHEDGTPAATTNVTTTSPQSTVAGSSVATSMAGAPTTESTAAASTTVGSSTTVASSVPPSLSDDMTIHQAARELADSADLFLNAQVNALTFPENESNRTDAAASETAYEQARATFERIAGTETRTRDTFLGTAWAVIVWLAVGLIVTGVIYLIRRPIVKLWRQIVKWMRSQASESGPRATGPKEAQPAKAQPSAAEAAEENPAE